MSTQVKLLYHGEFKDLTPKTAAEILKELQVAQGAVVFRVLDRKALEADEQLEPGIAYSVSPSIREFWTEEILDGLCAQMDRMSTIGISFWS
jgi:hypothetical protein